MDVGEDVAREGPDEGLAHRPVFAADEDQLGALAAELDGDREAVGEHGQAVPSAQAGHREGGAPAVEVDRPVRRQQAHRAGGDALLLLGRLGGLDLEVRLRRALQRDGAAVDAAKGALGGELVQIAPDRGGGDAQGLAQVLEASGAARADDVQDALPALRGEMAGARLVSAGIKLHGHAMNMRVQAPKYVVRHCMSVQDLPSASTSRAGETCATLQQNVAQSRLIDQPHAAL
ncbi:MAG: hypothetical protein U0838_07330 [Chloroflexota bacterium]